MLLAALTVAAPAVVPAPAAADTPTLVVVKTLGAVDDVHVMTRDNHAAPAHPDSSFLLVGGSRLSDARGYLRFDLSSLPEGVIQSAALRLSAVKTPSCGHVAREGIEVRRVGEAWSADYLHWGNTPVSVPEDAVTALADLPCGVAAGETEWPVTGIVQDWAAGAENHGLVLGSPDESTDDGVWYLASSETQDHPVPRLLVTMEVPSTPSTNGLYVSSSHRDGDHMWLASTAPQVYTQVRDPAGGRLTAEFQIDHDPAVPEQGTGLIWTATSNQTTDAGKPTVRVPEGILQDGWRLRLRVRAHNVTAGTVSDWSPWQSATLSSVVPEITGPEMTPSHQSDGVTVTTSLTPTFRATASHPFIEPLHVAFEIEHDPAAPEQGTGYIWSGSEPDATASGAQTQVTVPEGILQDGWRLRWRVRANAGPFASQSEWQTFTVGLTQ
ncbi:DNRLRE domain-containing protein [Herbidospora galbida]|uniref:DNRLRE domain-containing protein n=1 Tax=Herbidospora galbida TaxID=2575442 RepID=A0A4U3LW24_9ACTN|nr:DNRLRE domain-containing protein [Herbidospora galbida]TKK79016.1 DNRLRE domain-containing protein [Herbidospora galbida]